MEEFFKFRKVAIEFMPEMQFVSSSCKHHRRLIRKNRPNIYFLRRSIHRLEKGLTSKHKKHVFGLDYIYDTVLSFEVNYGIDKNTSTWAEKVLKKYFDVVSSDKVNPARERFFDFIKGLSEKQYHIDNKNSYDTCFGELVKKRKSVRYYKKDLVKIEDIVDSASLASNYPSACNRQNLKLIIVRDKKKLKIIKSIELGWKSFVNDFNAIVFVVADFSAYEFFRDRHLPYIEAGLFSMSFVYALESKGVSSCFVNWPESKSNDRKINDILGLSDFQKVIIALTVGYEAKQETPDSCRKDIGDFYEIV